ncbi:Flp pilus assembly complex ATPase component TadA [Candidatus Sumerlaeota bacterium]|nr:Flp pilus assembly complex ATPase component TadA [Candidatus Sumerlaeota bacterium]
MNFSEYQIQRKLYSRLASAMRTAIICGLGIAAITSAWDAAAADNRALAREGQTQLNAGQAREALETLAQATVGQSGILDVQNALYASLKRMLNDANDQFITNHPEAATSSLEWLNDYLQRENVQRLQNPPDRFEAFHEEFRQTLVRIWLVRARELAASDPGKAGALAKQAHARIQPSEWQHRLSWIEAETRIIEKLADSTQSASERAPLIERLNGLQQELEKIHRTGGSRESELQETDLNRIQDGLVKLRESLASMQSTNPFAPRHPAFRHEEPALEPAIPERNDALVSTPVSPSVAPSAPATGNQTPPAPAPAQTIRRRGGARFSGPQRPPDEFDTEQRIARWALSGQLYWILGVTTAFLAGWWWLPRRVMSIFVRRLNPRAPEHTRSVQRWGLIMLIPFLWNEMRGGGGGKNRAGAKEFCPHCSGEISDINLYSDLKFSRCPHCGEEIQPLFHPKDYLKHLTREVEKQAINRRSSHTVQQEIEKDAMPKLVNGLHQIALQGRGTDMHIDMEGDELTVRYRVDGVMRELMTMPRIVGPPLISAIKVQANIDITEKRIPQDGRFSIEFDQRKVDVRINTSPGAYGDTVSMRYLDSKGIMVTPAQLGFEGYNLKTWMRAIKRPNGMILVTGPTGSGKSTTLYVSLRALNTGERNIITIEDPIEYQLKGLKQLQVNVKQGFTFANGLRSIMRQDPDVIMVGEVRDNETAEIAVDAALTGHLVFTTLHTIDCSRAISRLNDLGIEARRYAVAITLIMAQRLIRVNCPHCREVQKPDEYECEIMDYSLQDVALYQAGQGCEACEQSGYLGRVGLFEMFSPNAEIVAMLEGGTATIAEIKEAAQRNGMRTLQEEGIAKVESGETTLKEVLRVTS